VTGKALGVALLTMLLVAACGSPQVPAAPATGAAAPTAATATAAPPTPTPAQPLLVLAAADLQYALPEIAAEFEKATGHKPTITLGSTGNIAAQIENGAPADLFFAADQSFIARLAEKGRVRADSRRVYAIGHIVITPARTARVEVRTLQDLTRPELKKIAIANPEHAPYVQTGNAEAGIVALSVALGVPGTPYTLIDDALHAPLLQEAAVLTASKQPERARTFLEFVNGPQGRPIMQKYGFVLPGE
jgi:molybdate transport system substrate-binding protein